MPTQQESYSNIPLEVIGFRGGFKLLWGSIGIVCHIVLVFKNHRNISTVGSEYTQGKIMSVTVKSQKIWFTLLRFMTNFVLCTYRGVFISLGFSQVGGRWWETGIMKEWPDFIHIIFLNVINCNCIVCVCVFLCAIVGSLILTLYVHLLQLNILWAVCMSANERKYV